jgi:hypothetical protein
MLMPLFAAALMIQDAPAIPAPMPAPEPSLPASNIKLDELRIEQAAAARCAIAYATISRWQKTRDARGAEYPDTDATGGREFFVQVMAKLMDETGGTRDDIAALTLFGVMANENAVGTARLKEMMPACELMKSAAGL